MEQIKGGKIMDLITIFNENLVIGVMLACLVVGYIIKTSLDFIPNKYIPSILAVLGAIFNCIIGSVSFNTIVYGALMGLASTGMHQMFTRFIEHPTGE